MSVNVSLEVWLEIGLYTDKIALCKLKDCVLALARDLFVVEGETDEGCAYSFTGYCGGFKAAHIDSNIDAIEMEWQHKIKIDTGLDVAVSLEFTENNF